MFQLKGFVKNGLDSSSIINIIVSCDSEFSDFKERGFMFPPHLFYYHEISWPEIIGVLINSYKFTKDEAVRSMNKLISVFNLQKIKRTPSDELIETLVQQANETLAQNNTRLTIGRNDIIIIAGFWREKVHFVHSGDEAFAKTCEKLGLNAVPVPQRQFLKEKEIKRWTR